VLVCGHDIPVVSGTIAFIACSREAQTWRWIDGVSHGEDTRSRLSDFKSASELVRVDHGVVGWFVFYFFYPTISWLKNVDPRRVQMDIHGQLLFMLMCAIATGTMVYGSVVGMRNNNNNNTLDPFELNATISSWAGYFLIYCEKIPHLAVFVLSSCCYKSG